MTDEDLRIPAKTLRELSVERQFGRLWQTTGNQTEVSLEWALRPGKCGGYQRWGVDLPLGLRAFLGTDGRYHAAHEGDRYCLGADFPDHCAVIRWCLVDGKYRLWPKNTWLPVAAETPEDEGKVEVWWDVELTDQSKELHEVPRHMRCQYEAKFWPPPVDSSRAGRVRKSLMDAFGNVCVLCHQRYGVFVDHEPFSGRVRGLLCRRCNDVVDDCAHVSGCGAGAYLDDPPAAALGLTYPGHEHPAAAQAQLARATGLAREGRRDYAGVGASQAVRGGRADHPPVPVVRECAGRGGRARPSRVRHPAAPAVLAARPTSPPPPCRRVRQSRPAGRVVIAT